MKTDYYRTRRTVGDEVTLDGVGLHTGKETSIRLSPSESEGIQFTRVDLESSPVFRPTIDSVIETQRGTVLGSNGHKLHTVEHLLAVFYGLGITDVAVRVDGPEIPAADGSGLPFVELVDEAGLETLNETKPPHRVERSHTTTLGDSTLTVASSPRLTVEYVISYDNPAIGDQFHSYELDPKSFREQIAPARTYGFKEEVEDLLDEGLAQGGSLDNALVVDEDGQFLGDGPRLEKEFVRHKILDLLGDLALSGRHISGKFLAVKSSHELNVNFLQAYSDEFEPLDRTNGTTGEDRPSPASTPLDVQDIRQVLPHRYPFLLIDRIVSIDYENSHAVGYKNVTINEEYFQGHFPDDPIMPGVLVVEAMAQLGAACILRKPKYEGKNSYFMGLDDVKWRNPVRPGDRVYFEIEGQRMRSRYGLVEGVATVDGEVAAEGLYKFAIVDQ